MEAKRIKPSTNGTSNDVLPSALAAEAANWEEDLSQVESKLSGFEKDITEQESTLADLLNKCDAMLQRLEEEVPGEGKTTDSDIDSDDNKLEEEIKLLGKAMNANDSVVDTYPEGSLPWFSIQLKEEAAFVAAGLETSDKQSDSGFLCEFCGNLIVQNDNLEVHRLNCCQSVATK